MLTTSNKKKHLEILCIIPARAGSKGIPKKNIQLLGAHPLLTYSIAAAKTSKKINKIIVTTDSQEIADIAQLYKAEVPFLRPAKYSDDKAIDIDYILHALKWLEENEYYTPDLVVLLRPTTPLRDATYIDSAIIELLKDKNATSLRSSHPSSEAPFKWFYLNNKYYTTISKEYTLDDTALTRQSFPTAYVPNGYVDIINPKYLKQKDSLYGDKILGFITPVGYDIDTREEFEYVEYLLSKQKLKILQYLKKMKEKI